MKKLYYYLDKNIRFEDISGNIIEAFVQDYDDGTEEDEDDFLYLNPYLWLENVKVIKNVNYNGDKIISQKEIKTIEII